MITTPIWAQILVFAAFFFLGWHVRTWWVERRRYAAEEIEVCGMCGNGHRIHDMNSGHCVSASCECEVGR